MLDLDRQLLGYLRDDLETVIAELNAIPGTALPIFRLSYQHAVLQGMLKHNAPKEAAA